MTDSPINRILGALRQAGCEPKEKGPGKWDARCPGHEDRKPSLGIKELSDGTLLVKCLAGCDNVQVLKAIGLKLDDLFPPKPGPAKKRRHPKPPAPANGDGKANGHAGGNGKANGHAGGNGKANGHAGGNGKANGHAGGNGKAFRTPELALAWHVEKEGGRLSKQGPWTYVYADGSECFRIYRIDKADGDKAYRPVYRDLAGWHVGDPFSSGLPLYHLDELLDADTVYLCEGEKCADLVRMLGFIATTSSHGAKSAKKTDWSPFAGLTVVVLPDHDDAGESYMGDVGPLLLALDPPPTIRVLRLPLRTKGDDVEQWIDELPDTWDDQQAARELARLAEAAPEWPGRRGPSPRVRPAFDGDPRPITTELLPVSAFDASMIPAPLRPWLEDIARRGCFPLEYPAAAAIVGISGLIGRRIGIKPKRHDDWLVVPNLWGAIVGPPGIQKTPAIDEALRPLKRLAADALERHKQDLAAYRAWELVAAAKKDAAVKELNAAARNGSTDAELGNLARLALIDSATAAPTARRYLVNDATLEKLGEILKDNPHGVMVFRDELTGWLKSMDKDGRESDRGFYLEAWNGNGDYTWDRIARGTVVIPNVCVSVFGTIQPGPLSHYLRGSISGEDADGFMPRFQVLLYPDPPKTFVHVDRYPDSEAKNAAYAVFHDLARLDAESCGCRQDAERSNIPFVNFTDAAQMFFDDWRAGLENRLRSGILSNVMASHFAKYRSLLPSIALIFHLIDVHGRGEVPPVSLEAAVAAKAWCDLLESHARRIYQAGSDGDPDDAIRLAQRIEESLPDPFTYRQVAKKGWTGLSKVEDVRRAVGILEDRGWVKVVEEPTTERGGRPSEQVWINPRIHGEPAVAPSAVAPYAPSEQGADDQPY